MALISSDHEGFLGKSILILGGDGFCGWPTALRFSELGADVTIVDNGSRHVIDARLGISSLTDIRKLPERVDTWISTGGRAVTVRTFDLAEDPAALRALLLETRPDIAVHFAEQRSAPFSMESAEGARYSIGNNIRATHNVLAGLVETGLDTHVVHLGTIGVYGYETTHLCLPEGYVKARLNGADGREIEQEILFPGNPVSIYHLSKVLDQSLSAFYARHYGLRITELHQGVVWGTQTAETGRDPRLVNRFDCDSVFGTVVNRFLVQAFLNQPLTVYGSGRQTRAFIHIKDMLTCIRMAAETPPQRGERVRIVNQFSETCTINALARKVVAITGSEIAHIPNPRQEPDNNELEVSRGTLDTLVQDPATLDSHLASEFATVSALLGDMSWTEIRNRSKVA